MHIQKWNENINECIILKKKIKHSLVIEEKGKMRSQKSICTPVENIEKKWKQMHKKGIILCMHAVCIDNYL